MNMTLFLIGYMASGKTTLGRALGRALGCDFIDLDFYIEQRYRKSVREIFATEGEERFREIEREMLHEVGEFCNVIIACGGGTPCHFDNMEYMNSRGVTVRLQASVARTVERLLAAKGKRPIVAKYSREELPGFVEKHLAEREPYYSQAKVTIGSDKLESREQIAATVKELIGMRGIFVEKQ